MDQSTVIYDYTVLLIAIMGSVDLLSALDANYEVVDLYLYLPPTAVTLFLPLLNKQAHASSCCLRSLHDELLRGTLCEQTTHRNLRDHVSVHCEASDERRDM